MFTSAPDGPRHALFMGLSKKVEFCFSPRSPRWVFLVGGGNCSPRGRSGFQAEECLSSLVIPTPVSWKWGAQHGVARVEFYGPGPRGSLSLPLASHRLELRHVATLAIRGSGRWGLSVSPGR